MQPLPCTTPATLGPNNMAITKESDLDPQGRQQDLEHESVTDAACVERLGRDQPPCFPSLWSELIFCFSIVISQVLAVRVSFVFPQYVQDT
jgi:hypothetical protein